MVTLNTGKGSKADVVKDLMLSLKVIAQGTDNGIIIIDRFGEVREFNSVAENLLGVPSTDILEHSYLELNGVASIIENSIESHENVLNLDITFDRPENIVYCLLSTIHILDGDSYRGTYVQLRDVTEKRMLEQQLISVERLSTIGQLAAGLAHEIRNPLTTISGFLQIMQSSGDYSKVSDYIPIVSDELNRLKKLVSDFVEVSKPTQLVRRDVLLQTFISSMSELMSAQAALKGVEIDTDYTVSDAVSINIDESQIKQVLMNAIQNSIEAMEETGGKVTLACNYSEMEGTCCISVLDTGVGMDESELSKIMTPFFTTKEFGTGLGLSVSHKIIKDHKGIMKFFSQKGVGTRLDIYLPLTD